MKVASKVKLSNKHSLIVETVSLAESELPKATSTSALSGAGVMRLFNKVGETVNKITYKMDESDPVSTGLTLLI